MPQRKKFAADGNVKDQIQKEIEANPVVVFMKGVPSAPMCGFSKQVVEVLKTQGVPFKGINVLADPDVREGEFSNWPTVPQLYIGGEFIGGCDITVELHQSGELAEELRKAGVKD
ncbi:glutaredoxin [Emiliania huxleyi CCMP1516]|uniref:Glutaredoxin n=2 Tax=Emiliania huxleyi TaxID=2903 RepID=A0A0D3JX88_EMIH1|nr:glutaredoxin [Emiliania huxleyi CCMP1516]XP_005781867.1 glutaredoxin [Emiliania huxleyi CCMP1516]EOD28123.1 glutaredoxin [Emiliania huxleyi CCMP1516]EOD29438.1 glutaredoxin [Emiliania huxleyi CCMP1516]|eukprot:XP_005780552.1 glutaredoxin [Emiliania huxleyi CCMP1516]